MEKHFANLDGFRCYKVKNRGDKLGEKLYIAPVYVIGLPGDVDMLNKEMENTVTLDTVDEFKKVPMTNEEREMTK